MKKNLKWLTFALITAMSLSVVSCGKKSSGGGSDDDDYTSSLSGTSTKYKNVKATFNLATNTINIGSQTYNIYNGAISQSGLQVLTNAYNAKPTNLNMYSVNGQYVYRLRMSARLMDVYTGGYGYSNYGTATKVLDVRTAKFVNSY